jgi:Predicted transmembrane sensor domain
LIYVSAVDVLEGHVAPEMIAGKLVLIGTSAVGLLDVKTTPIDPVMPGVEVHAQVLESALTRALLLRPSYGVVVELCAAIVLGILVIAFAPLFGPITLVAVGGLFASLLVGTAWYFYWQHRLLIDFTYPLLSTTAIYLTR